MYNVSRRSLSQAKTKSSVFYYHFSHLGSYTFSDVFANDVWGIVKGMLGKMLGRHESNGLGVAHVDEVMYLMR